MSDTTPNSITIPIFGGTVREVHGAMPDEGMLQQATQALLAAGFDRGDLSLPDPTATKSDPQAAGSVAGEHDVRQARTLVNSTVGVAAALIGGTVASVATAGAAIPVAAAAVTAAIGAGGATQLGFQNAADNREAEHDAQGTRGQLILAALVRDEEKEKLATDVLQKAGATHVETIERHGNETRLA